MITLKIREPSTWVCFLRIAITFTGNIFSAHFFSHFHSGKWNGFTDRADIGLLADGILFFCFLSLKSEDLQSQITQHPRWEAGPWIDGLFTGPLLLFYAPPTTPHVRSLICHRKWTLLHSEWSWNFLTAWLSTKINVVVPKVLYGFK